MNIRQNRKTWRRAMVLAALAPAAMVLTGCGDDDDSSSSDEARTGTFVDSPVAGLDYTGSDSSAGRTNERGEFRYQEGETITFAIGDLELGAAEGAEVITPLSISDGADSVDDPGVTNRLILLQSLDADGDLNNGIQITDGVRDQVSAEAMTINFDQAPEDFRAAWNPYCRRLTIPVPSPIWTRVRARSGKRLMRRSTSNAAVVPV